MPDSVTLTATACDQWQPDNHTFYILYIFQPSVNAAVNCPVYEPIKIELTPHHCEAKEVQLFDSKDLCHTIENILRFGLWLEQMKRQRGQYSC